MPITRMTYNQHCIVRRDVYASPVDKRLNISPIMTAGTVGFVRAARINESLLSGCYLTVESIRGLLWSVAPDDVILVSGNADTPIMETLWHYDDNHDWMIQSVEYISFESAYIRGLETGRNPCVRWIYNGQKLDGRQIADCMEALLY